MHKYSQDGVKNSYFNLYFTGHVTCRQKDGTTSTCNPESPWV